MDNILKSFSDKRQLLIVDWTRAKSGSDSAPSVVYASNSSDFTVDSSVGGKVTANKDIKLLFNLVTHTNANNVYDLYDASGNNIESLNATYTDQSFSNADIKKGYYFKAHVASDHGYTTRTVWFYE